MISPIENTVGRISIICYVTRIGVFVVRGCQLIHCSVVIVRRLHAPGGPIWAVEEIDQLRAALKAE